MRRFLFKNFHVTHAQSLFRSMANATISHPHKTASASRCQALLPDAAPRLPEGNTHAAGREMGWILHIKGDPCLPPKRGLFPRHLRATLASFFVQVQKPAQRACVPGVKGKNSIKKIVQNCAGLCIEFPHRIENSEFSLILSIGANPCPLKKLWLSVHFIT
jgi:hypothetical protein